jgi:hypothetical protein
MDKVHGVQRFQPSTSIFGFEDGSSGLGFNMGGALHHQPNFQSWLEHCAANAPRGQRDDRLPAKAAHAC